MKILLFVVLLIAILVIVCFALAYKKEHSLSNSFKTINVDILDMETVVKYFKSERILSALERNLNYKAVAIRENEAFDKIILTIFDDKSKSVIDNYSVVYKCNGVDLKLKSAFGDKSMIILQ